MEKESRYKIIRRAFLRLAVTSMFVMLATNICGFVDNIAVSRMLGTQELAAVGLFSPVAMVIGFCYVLIVGSQVLCANYIGAGKKHWNTPGGRACGTHGLLQHSRSEHAADQTV